MLVMEKRVSMRAIRKKVIVMEKFIGLQGHPILTNPVQSLLKALPIIKIELSD
jgi:hypothetical protein